MRVFTRMSLTLVFLVAFAFVSNAAPVKLLFWHMEARPHRVKAIEELCKEFNKENPDIEITPQVQSWGEIYQLAPAAIQARRGPDFMLTIPDFLMFIKNLGVLQPVTDIVNSLKQKYLIFDSALEPYSFDGNYWAVPIYGMTFVLWYRRDIFEKAGLDPDRPPKTWDELLAYCEHLKKSGVIEYPIAVPGAVHMATDQLIYSLMVVNKAEHLFGENPKEIIFDNPRAVQVYDFYKKLFSYSPPGSANWAWDEPRTALFTGRVAMVMEKGHYIKGWVDNTQLPLSLLGCAPIPVPQDGQPGAIYYSNGLMLLTNDPAKRSAFAKFISWLYQPKVMSKLLHMDPGFFLPVTREVLYSDYFWNNPIIKEKAAAVLIQIETAKSGKLFGFTRSTVNPNVGSISASNLLAWTAQLITVKGLDPKEAVRQGAERMKEAIK